jgi:hypothetical protein
MVQEIPRKLTRHLLICVNSFNLSDYVKASLSLVQSMNAELMYGGIKYTILCTYGGADDRIYNHGNVIYASHTKNLSDHNSFIGILCAQHVLPNIPITCVFMHDSCTIKSHVFRAKMKRLSRLDINGWAFAHALGLYNIGVCDLNTALTHAMQWKPITHLDKQVSIALEHTRSTMIVETHEVKGLRALSNFTLSAVDPDTENVDDVDSQSVGAILKFGKRRHVVYLSSLGVFKYSHTPVTFLLPIWVGGFAPHSNDDFNALNSDPVIKQHGLEWARALVPLPTNLITVED